MKFCVLILSCSGANYRAKAQAQRDTWRRDADGIDIRVFLGRGAQKMHDDEIVLDCDDGYCGLPDKVRLAFKWGLDNGYDYCLRADDDTYIQPQRLLAAVPVGHDYVGRLRGPSGSWKAPYASGFAYWLSAKAMRHRVYDPQPKDVVEDRATATMMLAAGIKCHPDYRYVVSRSKRNALSDDEGPRRGNAIVAACEYEPDEMHEIHEEWLSSMSKGTVPMMPVGTPFDRICVIIKTLMRDPMMFRCVESILKYMPGAKMVIVDDGFETKQKIKRYADLRKMGHVCQWMEFDAGFGAKNNEALKHCDREFALIASDDFIFDSASADGVLKMLKVLDYDDRIGVASGRVDNAPYEGNIVEEVRDDGMIHLRLVRPNSPWRRVNDVHYMFCDMTVNYNLIRREVFPHIKWHEEFKIGGDHLLFYQQVKAAGFLTAYVHGVSIHQQGLGKGDALPQYSEARGRARLALPDLFRRMNWYKFTGLDGRVDTLESVQKWCDDYYAPPVSSDPGKANKAQARREKEDRKREFIRARHEARKKAALEHKRKKP